MKRWMILSAMAVLMTAGVGRADPMFRTKAAEFQQIGSRIFDAARYEVDTHTLTIVFNNGAAYRYSDVPREVYLTFMRVVNKGEYFGRNIRNAYACERIDSHSSAWASRD